MNINVLRIGLALFWFVIGVGVLFRTQLGLANLDDRIEPRSLDLFGYLGVGLAGWNVLRWWFSRQRTPGQSTEMIRTKLAERRERTERQEEYIPELDFTKEAVERPKPAP